MREMKDSGIEWIGEIANTHKLVRLKYVAEILDEYRKPVTAQYRNQNADILYDYYGASGIIDKIDGYTIDDHVMLIGEDGANLKLRNLPLMYEVCGKAWINNHAHILKPMKNMDFYYLFYALEALDINNYITGSAQPKLNQENLKEILIPLPSYEVQKKVSSYLDTKCSEIDATVEDIQKEITLLEDYKKSVITEAVTKGLNPDAEMKDSKIFYLGKINKTWNLTKVGYCCKKLYRPFEPSDEALVCSNKGKVVPRGDTLIGLMTSDDNAMQGICKGDIAIHGMDTWHGAIACSDYDGKITRVVHVCKADGDNRFVVYWLQHLAFVGVYKLISNGVRGNTSDFRSWDKVADIYVPNPIKEEQQQIADFLDSKCSEIDSLIADKKRQLDILADYKKSLIYEYVTGKKEVPVNE